MRARTKELLGGPILSAARLAGGRACGVGPKILGSCVTGVRLEFAVTNAKEQGLELRMPR